MLFIPFLLLGLYFVPARVTESTEGGFQALKAAEHMMDPVRVAKWMEPFASADPSDLRFTPQSVSYGPDTLVILRETAVDIKYKRSTGSKSRYFLISVEPGADKRHSSNFKLSYITSLLNKWRGGDPLEKEMRKNLQNLGRYMGDPVSIYGFDIKRITVTDTTFLFTSKVIDPKMFVIESKGIFDLLINEAKKRNVSYNGVRIFHTEQSGKDERVIYAGIGISRSVETSADDAVRCKKMPFGHNLLSVDYEGPYYNLGKIYQAMDDYRADNGMTSMAIPFHKYLTDGYGFTDSQTVKLRVCYPVY